MEEGLRFRPTEAELLKSLRQFVVGQYTSGLIERRDLYGDEEPWEICTSTGTATDDNTWYFFTKLKRKNAAGKRFLRSVGKGTWHGTSKVEKIFHDERKQILLGFKRDFTYWGDEERRGEFVMNEFSLPENTVKPDRKDFVICRLKRKKAAPPPPRANMDGPATTNNDGIEDVTYEELFAGLEVAQVLQQEDLAPATSNSHGDNNIIAADAAAAVPIINNPRTTANLFGYVHPFDYLGESEEPFQHNNIDDNIIIAPTAPTSIPATSNGIHDNMSSFAASLPPPDDDFFRGLEAYEHQNWSSSNNVGDDDDPDANHWTLRMLDNYDDDMTMIPDDDHHVDDDDDDVLIDLDMLLHSPYESTTSSSSDDGDV